MTNKENDTNIEFNKNVEPNLLRTKFLISLGFLLFQTIFPGLALLFLTGTDFTFSYKLPFWLMSILMLSYIILTFLITFCTYKFKWHQLDQFTYAIPFTFVIGVIYLSGYYLNSDHILIRFIIALGGAIIGIFLTSIILLLFIRKTQDKTVSNPVNII